MGERETIDDLLNMSRLVRETRDRVWEMHDRAMKGGPASADLIKAARRLVKAYKPVSIVPSANERAEFGYAIKALDDVLKCKGRRRYRKAADK